jgi:hypothetical protein
LQLSECFIASDLHYEVAVLRNGFVFHVLYPLRLDDVVHALTIGAYDWIVAKDFYLVASFNDFLSAQSRTKSSSSAKA